MSDASLYEGREQSLVKHEVLRHYLQRFAQIIGSFKTSITYVDGFSGPWNARSDKFEDSSFAIALEELRKARVNHPRLKLRCLFLEEKRKPYAQLKAYADSVQDAEIKALNADFEKAIPDIEKFVRHSETFPFYFIDSTGWTGFAMETIAPMLKREPSEVLINFMTGHITRFINSPEQETQESFRRLFGNEDFRERMIGLRQQDRQDAAVTEYRQALARACGYRFTCSAIVLHPEFNRTHFHLIYGTRDAKGVEVFKDAERRAMKIMEEQRAAAQQRKRQKGGQMELLGAMDVHDHTHYDGLRERYLASAKDAVVRALLEKKRVPYDDIWSLALSHPLMWESDLKTLVAEWCDAGKLCVDGLKPRQRVPQRGEGHHLQVLGEGLF